MWDTAGTERFHCLSQSFYRGADCCVLVFDVNNLKTLNSLDGWFKNFVEQAGIENPTSFPFVILGNKIDLEHMRVVNAKKAKEWCKEHGDLLYYETSAKEGLNIDQAFQAVARLALSQTEIVKFSPVDQPLIIENEPPHPRCNQCII